MQRAHRSPGGWEDGSFGAWAFVSFFVTVFLVTFSKSQWLFCAPPHPIQKALWPPEPPASHLALQVSAATGLRGHGLGAARLPQLAKGHITILNA